MMKFFKFTGAYLLAAVLLLLSACADNKNRLATAQFAEQLQATPDAQLVDVRTPEEFGSGYLAGAVNINWSDDNFENEIGELDKNKPVFLYCMSDHRSGLAAKKMRSMGFTEVYDMKGGFISWRSNGLPIVGAMNSTEEMNKVAYDKLVSGDGLVLVDFYATWCAPCKKMAPFLDEISSDPANGVKLVRIDADKEAIISTELKIEALPTLILYRDGKEVWKHIGYISKEDLVKQIAI